MNWIAHVRREFARLGKQVDESVVEEMSQHATAAFEEARADGQPPDTAAAHVQALITSWCEGTSGPHRIERAPLIESAPAGSSIFAGLLLDMRQAVRLLRRQPGVASVSILMIALGIGVTATLFSLVNGVLLKPLPWKTADRLIRVYDTTDRLASNNDAGAMTNVTYQAWRDQPQTIDGVAGWSTVFVLVPGDGGIERVPAAMVTANLFPLLGASPILGSTFTEADERPDNTLVLSYGFWRERFGGATDVIGKAMSFGGRTRTIVGVMPRDFEFPTRDVRFWTPLAVPPAYRDGGTDHSVRIYNGLARLKPGITPAQAASEAEARLNTVPLETDRGYEPANLLTARIGYAGGGQPPAARRAFYLQTLERLTAIEGVTHAGITNSLPLTPANPRTEFNIDRARDKELPPEVRASLHLVTPGYFGAMGIRLVSGRDFSASETLSSEPVTIVNETFAREFLPGGALDARLPARLDEERRDGALWRVIGVVEDVRHRSPSEPIEPEMYAPMPQMTGGPVGLQYLTVRTRGDAPALAADLRRIVRIVNSNGVVDQVMTMETRLMWSLARPRLYAVLIGGFGAFALLIAGIGLFGALSYSVTQRTREIGVRTALGATPGDIVALVVRQGALMTIAGLTIGFLVAGWTGRYLSSFLFGVTPADPATFVVVGVAVAAIAAVACAVPARRAAKVDPVDSLRR